ncbi:unnamed protein product, partial [Didymodactylos carnosus]
SISFVIVGAEDHHLHFRHLIVRQILNGNYEQYGLQLSGDRYVQQTHMERDGTFSTEKEIFAAADVFKCTITIYQTDQQRWLNFKP